MKKKIFPISTGILFLTLCVSAAGIATAQDGRFRERIKERIKEKVKERREANGGSSTGSAQAGTATVPSDYQQMYTQLEQYLDQFSTQLKPDTNSTAALGASVLTVNSNMGERVLAPEILENTELFLDRLKELGIEAVQLDIQFPTFYSGYHKSQEERQQYIELYKKVAAAIRERGFVFAVESQVVFTQDAYSQMPVEELYKNISFEEYKKGRLETMEVILKELKPDYLTVGNEPSTEAALTKQPLTDPKTYADMMAYFISSLRAMGAGKTQLGVGLGSWERDYKKLTQQYVTQTDADFINIHIYPVNGKMLDQAYEIATIAKTHKKGVVLGEVGLYKIANNEFKKFGGINGSVKIYGRDAFDFWAPLDIKFLDTMSKFASEFDMKYTSLFWSRSLFAYIDYDKIKDLRPAQQMKALNKAAFQNITNDKFSALGLGYKEIIQRY